jgi:hypothetical protein
MAFGRFNCWVRLPSVSLSRRNTLAGLALGALAFPADPRRVDASKKRKKPLQLNAYGCVNVGGACWGSDANCCSGICQGKKPKKGRKDTTRCIAHNASTCQPGDNGIICGALDKVQCTNVAGDGGVCHTTTGNAGYCPSFLSCAACRRDSDCEATFGLGAACLVCGGCAGGTVCGWLNAA